MNNTSLIVNENMWNSVRVMWYTLDETSCWSTGDCIFGVITIILLVTIIVFIFYKYLD